MTHSEFQKLCEKYGLPENCTLQDISDVKRKNAKLNHPNLKHSPESKTTATTLTRQVNDDCLHLTEYLPLRDQHKAQQQKQKEQAETFAQASRKEPAPTQPQSAPPQAEPPKGFRRSDWQKEQTQKRKEQAQLMQQRLREQEQRREQEREKLRREQQHEYLRSEQEKRRKEQEAQERLRLEEAQRLQEQERERLRVEQEQRKKQEHLRVEREKIERKAQEQEANATRSILTSESGFVERCKKYGLSKKCTKAEVQQVRKQSVIDFVPTSEQSEEDVAVANELLSEVWADCDYLIAYLNQQAEANKAAYSTPASSAPFSTTQVKTSSDTKYRMIFSPRLLSEPDFAEIYKQHLEWCVQNSPSLGEAENVWTGRYNLYRERAIENQKIERQQREKEHFHKEQEKARIINEQEERIKRESELKRKRDEERLRKEQEAERERLALEARYESQFDLNNFSQEETNDVDFTRVHRLHILWCIKNVPSAIEARKQWEKEYVLYRSKVLEKKALEEAELKHLQKVREQQEKKKREQQIANLRADLTKYENELSSVNTYSSYISLSEASKTYEELKNERRRLRDSADVATHLQVIVLRCRLLEKKCDASKTKMGEWLASAQTKLSTSVSNTNSSDKSTTSDGAKIGAAIGGVLGFIAGMLIGAAVGGVSGLIAAGTGSIVEVDEAARARASAEIEIASYKTSFQEWEELIKELKSFREALDASDQVAG